MLSLSCFADYITTETESDLKIGCGLPLMRNRLGRVL